MIVSSGVGGEGNLSPSQSQPCGMGPSDLEAGRTAEPSGLADLLARVEAAEGPDRELDFSLCVALDDQPEWARDKGAELVVCSRGDWRGVEVRAGEFRSGLNAPAYTASLDAALALVDRALTAARVCMEHDASGYSAAEILAGRNHHTRHLGGAERADGETALALLAALLRALIAQATGGAA